MEPKTELRINASFLNGSACDLRNYFILIASIDNKGVLPIEIVFGSAFHTFAADMIRLNGDFGKALSNAKAVQAQPSEIGYRKDFLADKAYLTNVCTDWWDWHKSSDNFQILSVNGEPLVEKSFKLKVYEDDKLVIYLCGTIDKIGKFEKGAYGFGDYKTTSKSDKEIFFAMYRLRVQLRTYMWAITQHAKLYPDSIWSEICATPLVAFIDGIFLKSPSKGSMAEFVRSEMFPVKTMDLEGYEFMLQRKVQEIANMWHEAQAGTIPMQTGILEGLCDYCKYAPICANYHNPIIKEAVMKQHFVNKTYDPMTFGSKE